MTTIQGSILGNAVKRLEDPRFLKGDGKYMDDLRPDGLVSATFVRSTIAHARIGAIDTTDAKAMPGVVAVYTAADLGLPKVQGFSMLPPLFNREPLASEVVRYVGDPVALVVAATRAQAVDAAEAVIVDYEPLPVVVDAEKAGAADAPILFAEAGTNQCFAIDFGPTPEILDDADVVVTGRFVNQRVAAVPLEVNGCIAAPEGDGLQLHASTQNVFGDQGYVAGALGLPAEKVHVIAPMVGGGFGAKGSPYVEEIVICKAAMLLGRPVRWIETRSENLVNMCHGRGQVQYVDIGAKRDGTITGLRAKVIQDAGAYPGLGAILPFMTRTMASGVYTTPKIELNAFSYVTNTTPMNAYRGAGRPEAAAMLERCMDLVARELGLDPVDVRRKNLIPKEAFPLMTVSGAPYDVGDYERSLDEALRVADYAALRAQQAQRRASGDTKALGIGVSCYVEITAPAGITADFGAVEVAPDGSVTVTTGASPHGQGHETAWAQIASDILGVPMDRITLVWGDTAKVRSGGGTAGSRSLQIAGSAVFNAGTAVLDKAKQLAAHLLEAAPEDITRFEDGRLGVAGSPQSGLTWAQLAQAAQDPSKRPDGMESGLEASVDFEQGASSFPFGAHVSVVEVDTDTGKVTLLRHVAVDDCGRILNPMLVAGQQHGGIGQGIAQALFEEVVYDADGNPVTGTLVDYGFPAASELVSYEASNTETPTPLNPLGAKGIGESGSIGSTPAVQSAVVDALAHLGVKHIDMPLTPERVWRAIQAARS